MTNTRISFNLSPAGTFTMLIIIGILGYFVYDNSIEAAIAVMIVAIVVGIVNLLSLIPIIGWVTSVPLSYYFVIPKMLELTGIEYTWLIMAIFVLNVFVGLIITTFTTAAVIKIRSMRR